MQSTVCANGKVMVNNCNVHLRGHVPSSGYDCIHSSLSSCDIYVDRHSKILKVIGNKIEFSCKMQLGSRLGGA